MNRHETNTPRFKGPSVARDSTLIELHVTELEDLADAHAEHARFAIQRGEGEMHDLHECRAYELRTLAQRLRSSEAAA